MFVPNLNNNKPQQAFQFRLLLKLFSASELLTWELSRLKNAWCFTHTFPDAPSDELKHNTWRVCAATTIDPEVPLHSFFKPQGFPVTFYCIYVTYHLTFGHPPAFCFSRMLLRVSQPFSTIWLITVDYNLLLQFPETSIYKDDFISGYTQHIRLCRPISVTLTLITPSFWSLLRYKP